MAHSVSTWQTDGTSFKEASLSKISSNLRESIILWLDEHNDEQRRKMIETVFEALEKSGIKDTNDFFNIKKSFNIVKFFLTLKHTAPNCLSESAIYLKLYIRTSLYLTVLTTCFNN